MIDPTLKNRQDEELAQTSREDETTQKSQDEEGSQKSREDEEAAQKSDEDEGTSRKNSEAALQLIREKFRQNLIPQEGNCSFLFW